MAANGSVNDDSCIFDPNFAIICSFFEKFSTLCGIKQHTISELQLMIDSTEEISPQLIDLHVRLMRKAKKNVNPDRWQRTLAKFCYFNLPDDCWELEQKGYKQLHFSQRLRILLVLIGAQFDHNVKFKTDVNKLEVNNLRLTPFGRDKDGNNYWLHMDQDLNLNVYKEDLEEEKWELVVRDRDSLETLINELIKVKDPNRKLDDIQEDESEDDGDDDEDEELEEEHDNNIENITTNDEESLNNKSEEIEENKDTEVEQENRENMKNEIDTCDRNEKETNVQNNNGKSFVDEIDNNKISENVIIKTVNNSVELNSSFENMDTGVARSTVNELKLAKECLATNENLDPTKPTERKITKKAIELTFRPRSLDIRGPVKPLDKRSFASHLQKLDSNNMLRPLLNTEIPVNPSTSFTDNLKTKLGMKLKPMESHNVEVKTTADVLLSKVKKMDPKSKSVKLSKPGLKLEQILKSKLAQKLAANNPSDEIKKSSHTDVKCETDVILREIKNKSSQEIVSVLEEPLTDTTFININSAILSNPGEDDLKRKLNEETECENVKKRKIDLQNVDDEKDGEIEESVMLVTGVGSGLDCNTGNNETPSEKTEHNTTETNTNHMTHKVDNILKNIDHDQNKEAASTSVDDFSTKFSSPVLKSESKTVTTSMEVAEKKKPKLWTIDAICSSDSKTSDVSKSRYDDVSLFPNYSFNKEGKKLTENSSSSSYRNSTESYSFFNLSCDTAKDDHSLSSISTNFYFGCNNQNPCFLPTERNVNTFKSTTNKSHNVKDIVENLDNDERSENAIKSSNFNVENLCSNSYELTSKISEEKAFNLCIRKNENCVVTQSEKMHEIADERCDIMKLNEKIDHTSPVSITSENDITNTPLVMNTEIKTEVSSVTVDEPENMAVDEPENVAVSEEERLLADDVKVKSVDTDTESKYIRGSSITENATEKPVTVATNDIPVTCVSDNSTEIDDKLIKQVRNENNESSLITKELNEHVDVTAKKERLNETESTVTVFTECIKNTENVTIFDEVEKKSSNLELQIASTSDSIKEHTNSHSNLEIVTESKTLLHLDEKIEEIKTEGTYINTEAMCNEEKNKKLSKTDINEIKSNIPNHEELNELTCDESLQLERVELVKPNETELIKNTERTEDTTETAMVECEHFTSLSIAEISPECKEIDVADKQLSSDGENIESIEKNIMKSEEEKKSKKGKSKVETMPSTMVIRTSTRLAKSARSKNEMSSPSPIKKELEKDSKTMKKSKIKNKIGKNEEQKEEMKNEENDIRVGMKKGKQTRKLNSKEQEKIVILTEVKSKKGKNRSLKNDENEQEEIVETKSLRKMKNRTTKDEISENEEAAETKYVKKGKNKIVLSILKENDTSKRGTKNKGDHISTDEGGDNNETNENLLLQSKVSKIKVKIKKSKKSINVKAETSNSSDDKESVVEEKSNQDEIENNKETKLKKLKLKNEEEEDISEKKEEISCKTSTKKRTLKRGWLSEVDVNNIETSNNGSPGIRQSRRIAQLKIKEQAEVKYAEPVTTSKKTTTSQKSKASLSTSKKNSKTSTKKSSKYKPPKEDSDEGSLYEKSTLRSRKKKKQKDPKKNFDVRNAWKASSGSSSEEEEAEDEDHFEDDEELVINDGSDHEFSPESDIDDDDEYQPVKRARTAHSKPATEDKPERDDLSCQSCGTADQPEWILLCDMCDEGWHASCLKPAIMSIPEGDWFCPPCQHNKLITNLQKCLRTFDKNLKKRMNEELRKKRLEYVGISFSNIIKDQNYEKQSELKAEKPDSDKTGVSDEYTDEESEDEPLYQLRIRRQANVSHRLNEYEELMNSAIRRDENNEIIEEGIDTNISSNTLLQNGEESFKNEIVRDEEELADDNKHEKNKNDKEEASKNHLENQEKVSPVILQLRNIRRKPPRLTKLDVSSDDDHFSDEDFKGSSGEDQDDDEEYGKSESDSDEVAYRRGREPVRRSTRARIIRYDNDFINDDSEEDDDDEYSRKNKKKRSRYSDSDSEEEDSTWGKRKKSRSQQWKPSQKKKRRRITFEGDSDEEKKKSSRRSRIKFGLDESEDDYYPQRRTRGKKISYLDNLGSESEEEKSTRRKSKKVLSDDDEEYINDENEFEHSPTKESIIGKNGEDESGNDLGVVSDKVKLIKPKELNSDTSEKSISPVKSSLKKESPSSTSTEVAYNLSQLKTYSKMTDTTKQEKVIQQTTNLSSDEPVSNNNEMKKKLGKFPKKEIEISGDAVKEDSKMVLKKIDANPSLEGLQYMAQNLSQNMNSSTSPAKYPATSIHDTKYQVVAPNNATLAGSTSVNFAEVGISYEDADGSSTANEKYAPPIRVVSPSKLYGMQDGQPLNRPPPSFTVGSRMQSPAVLSPSGNPMMMPGRSIPVRGPMVQSSTIQHITPTSSSITQPSNVNISQCGPGSSVSIVSVESASRRGRRGRGKKQLEMERLERERGVMESNRGEEMMPLHMLKLPHPEINVVRPPGPYNNPPTSQFSTYPQNVQRIPFSQASAGPLSTSVTVTVGNTPKRVKITPTRMRMPGSQNIMRFPRVPANPGLYPSHPHDSSPSGGIVLTNECKPPVIPGSTAAVTTIPVKTETQVSTAGIKIESSDQYFRPTSYSPSQMPRMYNQRPPEFSFVRNPLPPMYRQPQIVSSSPPTATTTSFIRPPYSNAASVITGGPSPSPAAINSSPTAKTEVSNSSSQVPSHPYSSTYSPSSTSASVVAKPNRTTANYTYTTSTHTSQPASSTSNPPTSVTYQMLPMKQLPSTSPQSSTPIMSYTAPYYTSSIMPNSYPPSSQLPSVSSFGPNVPTTFANQQGNRLPVPPSTSQSPSSTASPLGAYKHSPGSQISSVSQTETSNDSSSNEYAASTSQGTSNGRDFQYSNTSQSVPIGETESSRTSEYGSSFNQSSSFEEEKQTSEETSTGEFGGLVSYFSSQHEDNLDS